MPDSKEIKQPLDKQRIDINNVPISGMTDKTLYVELV